MTLKSNNEGKDPFFKKSPFLTPSTKVDDYHKHSDVDSGHRAQHHTLGKGHNQSAPGDHNHDEAYAPLEWDSNGEYAPIAVMNHVVPLAGAIPYFGTTDPSANFLILDGRELLRADYPELLSQPGVSFANGPSGSDYFVLPNPTNRALVGAGGTYSYGDTGGATSVTLTTAQLPSHTHGAGSLSTSTDGDHGHIANWSSADGTNATHFRRGDSGATTGTNSNMINNNGNHSHSVTGTTGSAGSGDSVDVTNPYLAVNFIMRVR